MTERGVIAVIAGLRGGGMLYWSKRWEVPLWELSSSAYDLVTTGACASSPPRGGAVRRTWRASIWSEPSVGQAHRRPKSRATPTDHPPAWPPRARHRNDRPRVAHQSSPESGRRKEFEMMIAPRTPALSVTPHRSRWAIDSPSGACPWSPFRFDRPSRQGLDGHLIANSVGGGAA